VREGVGGGDERRLPPLVDDVPGSLSVEKPDEAVDAVPTGQGRQVGCWIDAQRPYPVAAKAF
jgi:hypothetical protein